MEAVILRKKTLKAKLGLGKYTENTVQEVLAVEPSYLEWAYFSLSMITFTDDVLDLLGIAEEFRIEKPGKSKEMFRKMINARRDKWISEGETPEERQLRRYKLNARIRKSRRITAKRVAIRGERREQHEQGAGRLAWRNQGH